MSFSSDSLGNDLIALYQKINVKNKSNLSLSDLQYGIYLCMNSSNQDDHDSIIAKIWSACDFDKTQTITLDEFIVPGGLGETILRHFGTDLDIEIEIVETEASLIDHRQSHPSNELHVKCLKCQQIRIIKRPPGLFYFQVDCLFCGHKQVLQL